MPVLVVNAGSTSVKYKLFDGDSRELLAGVMEAGTRGGVSRVRGNGIERERGITGDELRHSGALIAAEMKDFTIDRMGFRVVHGGERFTEPVRITDAVLDRLDELGRLAPLHNPPAVARIRELRALIPGTPQYAVFDTAFHSTLPPAAYL